MNVVLVNKRISRRCDSRDCVATLDLKSTSYLFMIPACEKGVILSACFTETASVGCFQLINQGNFTQAHKQLLCYHLSFYQPAEMLVYIKRCVL